MDKDDLLNGPTRDFYNKNINRFARINVLLGKTLTDITVQKDNTGRIYFKDTNNVQYLMYHDQDCCETVEIKEIVGSLNDVIGTPIIEASEESNSKPGNSNCDSSTWTFYKIGTVKGFVTISWLGTSNGYYSEGVDFLMVSP